MSLFEDWKERERKIMRYGLATGCSLLLGYFIGRVESRSGKVYDLHEILFDSVLMGCMVLPLCNYFFDKSWMREEFDIGRFGFGDGCLFGVGFLFGKSLGSTLERIV